MNIITEAEALTKACCKGAEIPANSGVCIGSRCMAWRWQNTDEWVILANEEYKKYGRRIKSETGYCGLSGEPD